MKMSLNRAQIDGKELNHSTLPTNMASGWRKLLEEESEHQWLAIGLFFVFIIIGGFLIGGTSSLEGLVLGTDPSENLEFEEGEFLLEIGYHEDASWSEAHSAIMRTETGYKMYQQMDIDDVADILPPNHPQIENVTFFQLTEEGDVEYSSSLNQLSTYRNGMTANRTLDDLNDSEFGITAITVHSTPVVNNRLMITAEDGGSGLRGFTGTGLTTPSTPIDPKIVWDDVVYLEESNFLVAGTYTVQGEDESPATPSTRIVFAHVFWEGATKTPEIKRQWFGSGSEVHSIIRTSDGGAVAASNEELYIVSADASDKTHSYPSRVMVYDDCHNRVWLFGERGAETVLRVDLETESASSKNLPYPLPLQPTSGTVNGDVLIVHGFDAQGESDRMSLDLTIEGSLSSGRGFLNFGFLVVGVIMLVTQGYMMVEKAIRTYKA